MASSPQHKLEAFASSLNALLTIEDVAGLLRCSTKTVRRLVDAGEIPPPDVRFSRRLLRWRAATIRPLLEGRRR